MNSICLIHNQGCYHYTLDAIIVWRARRQSKSLERGCNPFSVHTVLPNQKVARQRGYDPRTLVLETSVIPISLLTHLLTQLSLVSPRGVEPLFTGRKPGVLPIDEGDTLVGMVGFEPTAPCSQSKCADRTALHPN